MSANTRPSPHRRRTPQPVPSTAPRQAPPDPLDKPRDRLTRRYTRLTRFDQCFTLTDIPTRDDIDEFAAGWLT